MPRDNSKVRLEGDEAQENKPASELSTGRVEAQSAEPRRVAYPPTRWTLVLEAAEGDEAIAKEAMAGLCAHYREAILGYCRMKCHDPHGAEDLAGSFVEHLLEKNRLRNFRRRENMRFRHYLSRALKYFFLDNKPEPAADPLESHPEMAGTDPEMDKQLDGRVALATHQRALAAVQENYARRGKLPRYERLQSFVLEEPEGDDYLSAAAELKLTHNAVCQAVFRLRHDYYEQFRAEVAQTVRHSKEEMDEETRYLMALLPAFLGNKNPL
jgi:DNA-directed RNA polymerase specialized sigma24 family protein